jgi:hypothetical protein
MKTLKWPLRIVAVLLVVPGILMLAGCFSVGSYRDVVSNGGIDYDKDEIAGEIEDALERTEGRREATKAILDRIRTGSDAGWLLARGLEDSTPDGLEARMREALDSLDFTNVIEAGIPDGFPEPSVTGLVRIKSYDSYRKARVRAADRGEEDGSLFMDLFDHISENDISMTAPVDMSMSEEDGGREEMSFYYGSAKIGSPGRQDGVEVLDTTPLTVVSVSVRGAYSDSNFEEAVTVLSEWLEENGDRWAKAGEPRILGYNSPFIPWFLKLSEVQIPVTERSRLASR